MQALRLYKVQYNRQQRILSLRKPGSEVDQAKKRHIVRIYATLRIGYSSRGLLNREGQG